MKTYEFWRDTGTGEVWAVELADGVVFRCYGPLHWSEISPSFLRLYDYSAEEAPRIEERREEFEFLDERAVVLLAANED